MNRLFVGLFGSRSCGVARSIIAGFHPVDPGSNPGTSTTRFTASLFWQNYGGKSQIGALENTMIYPPQGKK